MTPFKRRASLVAAILASILATAILGPTVSAVSAPYRLGGDVQAIGSPFAFNGTILAAGPVIVEHPRYFVLKAGPDGRFRFTLEATGGTDVVAIEVGIDLQANEQLLAVGLPTPQSVTWVQSQTPQATSSIAATDGLAPQTIDSGWLPGHGFFSTFWTDPAGITVNSVIDEARWYYDGVHVASLTGNDSRQWLSGNGWWEVSHSIGAYYNGDQTVGTVWTNDNFRTSSPFPPLNCGTTNTYYQANNAYGFADGHIGGGVNTWATGSCAYLLSYTAFASPGT